jgi:hypothetical protein
MLLAIVLVLGMSATGMGTTAQAAARVPIVTGEFAYEFMPGATTFIDIDARGGDVPRGSVSYSSTFLPAFWGEAECVTVVGSDAWISGVVTGGTPPGDEGVECYGWTLRVHDGGTPGTNGDLGALLYYTPELVNAYCEQADPSYDWAQLPLIAGNLVIHSAR